MLIQGHAIKAKLCCMFQQMLKISWWLSLEPVVLVRGGNEHLFLIMPLFLDALEARRLFSYVDFISHMHAGFCSLEYQAISLPSDEHSYPLLPLHDDFFKIPYKL